MTDQHTQFGVAQLVLGIIFAVALAILVLASGCAAGVQKTVVDGPVTVDAAVTASVDNPGNPQAKVEAHVDVDAPGVQGRCAVTLTLDEETVREIKAALEGAKAGDEPKKEGAK